ncbi:MAG: cytochrome P450 [Bradyrhizobium sp.]
MTVIQVGEGDAALPAMDVDPFAAEFLNDPYPAHELLREAGPVVRLDRYGICGVARHEEVRSVLSHWQSFCSSAGVGLSDFRKEPPWRPPSLLLETDPPLHNRARAILTRILSPAAVRKLQGEFEREAALLIDELIERGSFDAVKDFAERYPVKVFPDAVGLPEQGREKLLPYGSMVFNSFGPRNQLFEDALARAADFTDWVASSCSRASLDPEKFGAQIYAFADSRVLSEHEAGMLVRAFLSAGVDTTVNALGNAIHCFGMFPDQWALLRQNPSLARSAFEEVLRFESPIQTFFRTTTEDVMLSGQRISEGTKVLAFLGAANRDPRRWENPNRFDITRRASGHMAFGTGIHGCVGQAVARLEADAILGALAGKVGTIEIVGEPVRRFNNTLRGLQHLPVSFRPAAR